MRVNFQRTASLPGILAISRRENVSSGAYPVDSSAAFTSEYKRSPDLVDLIALMLLSFRSLYDEAKVPARIDRYFYKRFKSGFKNRFIQLRAKHGKHSYEPKIYHEI